MSFKMENVGPQREVIEETNHGGRSIAKCHIAVIQKSKRSQSGRKIELLANLEMLVRIKYCSCNVNGKTFVVG